MEKKRRNLFVLFNVKESNWSFGSCKQQMLKP